MAPRSRTRVVLALLLAALTLGCFTATAGAHRGGDDSGTAAGKRVALVGTVATVDPTARTFTLTVKNKGKHRGWHHRHHRLARVANHGKKTPATTTYTVNAGELTLPAVGDKALVKGTLQQDGTVTATAIRVLLAAADDNDDDATSGDDDGDRGDCAGKGRGHRHHDDDNRGS